MKLWLDWEPPEDKPVNRVLRLIRTIAVVLLALVLLTLAVDTLVMDLATRR